MDTSSSPEMRFFMLCMNSTSYAASICTHSKHQLLSATSNDKECDTINCRRSVGRGAAIARLLLPRHGQVSTALTGPDAVRRRSTASLTCICRSWSFGLAASCLFLAVNICMAAKYVAGGCWRNCHTTGCNSTYAAADTAVFAAGQCSLWL